MGSITEYAPSTKLWQKLVIGGTLFDAFMMESAQQVGQSLLNLPREFGQSETSYYIFCTNVFILYWFANQCLIIYVRRIAVGYAAGIIAVVFISILCMWCQFLLVSLLAEYEHIIATNPNHPRHGDKNFTASYHDVSEYIHVRYVNDIWSIMYDICLSNTYPWRVCVVWEIGGRWWGRLSLLVVFFALVGLGVAQIVSTTSNLYILTQGKKKLIVHNGHNPPFDQGILCSYCETKIWMWITACNWFELCIRCGFAFSLTNANPHTSLSSWIYLWPLCGINF